MVEKETHSVRFSAIRHGAFGGALTLGLLLAACGGSAHRQMARSGPLQQQMPRFLGKTPFATPPLPRIATPGLPGGVGPIPPLAVRPGGPCFVATRGGPCSLEPCIVYVQGAVRQAALPALAGGRGPPGARRSQVLRVSGP